MIKEHFVDSRTSFGRNLAKKKLTKIQKNIYFIGLTTKVVSTLCGQSNKVTLLDRLCGASNKVVVSPIK